jgi:hypothetical protein
VLAAFSVFLNTDVGGAAALTARGAPVDVDFAVQAVVVGRSSLRGVTNAVLVPFGP